MEILKKLVEHSVAVGYENLSDSVIEHTKIQILDTLGAIIAGSTASISEELEILVKFIETMGGAKESSIISFGGKVPAANAALVNGVMCARRDFDDTHLFFAGGHTSRSIIPTAFAIAEREGNVSGKDFITAVAMAHDLECRIAASGRGVTSWYMVSNFFGAAAAAGKILRLDENKMKNCLTLTFHQICGASIGGSANLGPLKGMSNGFTCKAGVLSAILANEGFGKTWDFLDPGKRGNFYDVFFNGVYAPSLVTLDLGKTFMGSKTSPKEYPCCHGQHVSIKTVIGLVKKYELKAEDVESITISVNIADYEVLAMPENEKRNPSNLIETQFSLYWSVACAVVFGEVNLSNFTEQALKDRKVLEIIKKIRFLPKLEFSRDQMSSAAPRSTPVNVEIATNDGKVYVSEGEPDELIGGSKNMVNFDFIADKFRNCCLYSTKPISEKNQEAVINTIKNIENIEDVGGILSEISR